MLLLDACYCSTTSATAHDMTKESAHDNNFFPEHLLIHRSINQICAFHNKALSYQHTIAQTFI